MEAKRELHIPDRSESRNAGTEPKLDRRKASSHQVTQHAALEPDRRARVLVEPAGQACQVRRAALQLGNISQPLLGAPCEMLGQRLARHRRQWVSQLAADIASGKVPGQEDERALVGPARRDALQR